MTGKRLYDLLAEAMSRSEGIDWPPWSELTTSQRRGWEQGEFAVYEEYAPEPEF